MYNNHSNNDNNTNPSLKSFDSVSFELQVNYLDEEHYDHRPANPHWSALILASKRLDHWPRVFTVKREFVIDGYWKKKFLWDGTSHINIRVTPITHPLFVRNEPFVFDSSNIEASTIRRWLDLPTSDNIISNDSKNTTFADVDAFPHKWECLKNDSDEIFIKTFGACSIFGLDPLIECHMIFKKCRKPRGLFLASFCVILDAEFCSKWLNKYKLIRDQKANFGNNVPVGKDGYNVSCDHDETNTNQ